MAQILNFRTPESRSDEEIKREDEVRAAEVIPFPGVRYERWGKESIAQSQERHRVRRDVIELADQ